MVDDTKSVPNEEEGGSKDEQHYFNLIDELDIESAIKEEMKRIVSLSMLHTDDISPEVAAMKYMEVLNPDDYPPEQVVMIEGLSCVPYSLWHEYLQKKWEAGLDHQQKPEESHNTTVETCPELNTNDDEDEGA
ncbi:hypothetical protein ARNL5_02483 [Anaerolineae bacterium]|nr:hypothetical protein ARNL5_02483 [Anaerolineae bacterium]